MSRSDRGAVSWSDGRLWSLVGGVLALLFCARWYTTAVVDHYSPAARPAAAVDLNRAEEEELREVPGVGPALASRIHRARETGGPFVSRQDLVQRVQGIGEDRADLLLEFAVLGAAEVPSDEARSESP